MKPRWTILAIAAFTLVSSAAAQNSDLGFLFGVTRTGLRIDNTIRFAETQISFQVNYAFQFNEGPKGRLYVELPLVSARSARAEVGRDIIAASGTTFFVVPGIRYHYNLTPRVAVYGAAGAGVAIRREDFALVSPNSVIARSEWKPSPAAGFGGGLDFRLTRMWSLRGEIRDFIATRSSANFRRNNVSAQFGVALHF